MKTKKFIKIPKNSNYFTCLLSFRILVNLPNFKMLLPTRVGLVRTFLKLNNGLYEVVIQFFFKSPHKSNLFRRESISKLPGGKPMNVFIFGLWSSYQIWQL